MLLKEMKKPTMEVTYDDELKGKKIEIPFEKDYVLPHIGDKSFMLKEKCDVDNGDWVFDSVHTYHICRN